MIRALLLAFIPLLLAMMLLVASHGHFLRLTVRRRVLVGGRMRTESRVVRLNRTCQRCEALSAPLISSSRQFRTSVRGLLIAAR
jgi:hypothetical protein